MRYGYGNANDWCAVVLTQVVTQTWTFPTCACALSPFVVLFNNWGGPFTNPSTVCVVWITNGSQVCVNQKPANMARLMAVT